MSGTHPGHVTSGPYAPPRPASELTVTSADGTRLHVELHGPEGAPVVVLAHGWTCSTAFWAPVTRRLAADHRVVLYDQRGHGRSAPAEPDGYGTETLADDLAAVLDRTLAPGGRAVLVGHSMGAMTLVAAGDRPQLRAHAAAVLLCSTGVSRLVAESRVLPLRPGRVRTRISRALLCTRVPFGPVTPLSMRLQRYVTMGPRSTRAMMEACTRIVHACPPAARAGWARVLAALDIEPSVARLTVPTAVLAGTADRLTPLPHARALAAGLPHCVGLTELTGLGHMTPVEDPDAVVGAIRTLVADHLTAEHRATEHLTADHPVGERPAAGQPTAGRVAAGQPMSGQATAGQPMSGQAAAERASTAEQAGERPAPEKEGTA